MTGLRNAPGKGPAWCGPAALANLTDGDYGTALAQAEALRGGRVKGMRAHEVLTLLRLRGLRPVLMPNRQPVPARRRIWHYLGPHRALILVRGHFLASDGYLLADQGATRWWADHYYARYAVRRAWRVVPA